MFECFLLLRVGPAQKILCVSDIRRVILESIYGFKIKIVVIRSDIRVLFKIHFQLIFSVLPNALS